MQAISLDPTPPLAVTTLAALMGQRYQLTVARPGEARYEEAFAFSADEYRRHFDCHLQSRYPAYFCFFRGRRLLAVCGFRAGDAALFLEQYLDEPAQELLARHFDCKVERSRIVELGGFAVRRGALALPFMALVAPALVAQGFSHAVATATMPVRRCVARLGVPFKRLAAADECRLQGGETRWGSYYRMRPAVIAGRIDGAIAHFDAMPS